MSKAIILHRSKKWGDDFSKLRVFVRLFDQSISVLEYIESIGEGKKKGRVGGDGKKLLQ